MRPIALGRKNWLHIGSPLAGPKVAAILSVVEGCSRLKVPVRDYFFAILPGLADLPIRCLPGLTPPVWVARQSEDSSNRGILAITRSLSFFSVVASIPCSESVKTVDGF
jgi:hypothetical protein